MMQEGLTREMTAAMPAVVGPERALGRRVRGDVQSGWLQTSSKKTAATYSKLTP